MQRHHFPAARKSPPCIQINGKAYKAFHQRGKHSASKRLSSSKLRLTDKEISRGYKRSEWKLEERQEVDKTCHQRRGHSTSNRRSSRKLGLSFRSFQNLDKKSKAAVPQATLATSLPHTSVLSVHGFSDSEQCVMKLFYPPKHQPTPSLTAANKNNICNQQVPCL